MHHKHKININGHPLCMIVKINVLTKNPVRMHTQLLKNHALILPLGFRSSVPLAPVFEPVANLSGGQSGLLS